MNRSSTTIAAILLAGSTAQAQRLAPAEAPPSDASAAATQDTGGGAPADATPTNPAASAPAAVPAGAQQPASTATASPTAGSPPAPIMPAAPAETTPPPRLVPMTPTPMPEADAEPEPEEPPAGPVTQHVQIAINVDTVIITDPSYEIFRDDNAAVMPGVSAGYAFWLSEAFSLRPEIGYSNLSNRSSGLLGGALSQSSLDVNTPYLGVNARYEIWDFFAPHVRLSGGFSRTAATVQFANDTPQFETVSWLPHATLGAGATLTTPDGLFRGRVMGSVALGLTVEGGYWLGAPLHVALHDPNASGRLPIGQPGLGDLSRSGPYVRGAAVVRF